MADAADDVEHAVEDNAAEKGTQEAPGGVLEPAPAIAAPPSPRIRDPDDPQTLVISSLRSQISDLISQVTQLNSKLVKSYDRVSDLEDELHIASSNIRSSSLKISQLELERTQHLAALNTGLLVEKSHVTSELTRLMERATDEAAARGQAESARANIEKDLDDLSANLFDQANTMVAEARYARAMSERKVVDAENALKSAEEVVGSMQVQMQLLREEKDKSAEEVARMQAMMGDGKFVQAPSPIAPPTAVNLLCLHPPYQEFILFVAHLRSVRPASPSPPPISTFLPLPFLARLLTEDSDPTTRLDFAPALNWLSRRSVLTAIYSGQLTIEPMSSTALLLESTTSSLQSIIPGANSTPCCALCGGALFPHSLDHPPPPAHPLSLNRNMSGHASTGSWSASLFKSSLSMSSAPSPPPTPPLQPIASAGTSPSHAPQIYVFRIAQVQPPAHAQQQQQQQRPTNYPLCQSGWCLTRLRTTCSLWAFIRAGVIDHVWDEPPPPPPSYERRYSGSPSMTPRKDGVEREKAPPLPPRARRTNMSMGKLWNMASGALASRSQPASPIKRDSKDGIDAQASAAELTPKMEAGKRSVTVGALAPPPPPPLPRRSTERVARISHETDGIVRTSSDGGEKVAADATGHLSTTNSESSNASDAGQLMPPSTSMSSPELFSTPTEEITSLSLVTDVPATSTAASASADATPLVGSAVRSAISPTAVPLPDSRPGTPLNSVMPRSRPTSMLVHPVQAVQAEEGKAPSRSASPVPGGGPPPPVPRRAAARRPVPGAPGANGIPPITSAALPPPVHPSHAATENSDHTAMPAPSEEAPPTALPPTADAAAKPTDEGQHQAPEPETKALPHNAPPPPPPRRADHTLAKAEPKVVINGTSVSVTSPVIGNGAAEELGKPDAMNGPFVSDGSWEERTWKEIVRLKEDMFWARIGGVRC